LVLRGPQAVGKTIVGEHLGHLFGEGRHFLTISHQQHITSRFNSHLANIILLLIDEATFPGDKSAWGHFKSLLTSPMLTIERKGTDIFTMPNFLHVILTSNSDWVVPVESFDRRWCVIDVGASRCKDTSFFKAMNEQLISGGYSGLLYDLLRMPLINLLSIPNTTARIDQKIHTMDPLEKWWLAILQSGELPGSDFEPRFSLWGETERRHLYGSYKDAVGKYPLDVSLWRKKLTTLSGLEDGPHRRTGIRGRQRTYKFPTLSECRARFERVMGVKIEWEKDDDAPHLTVVPAPDKVAAVEGGAV
jgi:hypothetical protein